MIPMNVWGVIMYVAIATAIGIGIANLVWQTKGRRATERMIAANEAINDRVADALHEARAAARFAADRAAANRELHRNFVEGMAIAAGMRDQCGAILEDMRALRGWPNDEVKRHPGPTPPGELPR